MSSAHVKGIAMKQDEKFMRRAINLAQKGVLKGQTPFAACVVQRDKVIAESHNKVLVNKDITAHAEVLAIRLACQKTKDVHLFGATLYSTCEPCPMCFAAAHWAGIYRIVYGARIPDADNFGFRELPISNAHLKHAGRLKISLRGGVLRRQVLDIFRLWQSREDHRTY